MTINEKWDKIDKHFEYLKGKRSTWERNWQELAEYVLPHRSDFTSKRLNIVISYKLL